MTISAVVLAKNEERNIERCIASLLWCDEIVVIDDNSKDKTVSKAKKYKVKLYQRSLHNNFAQQRNFGLENASSEWIFFVDADEVVTDRLQKEIVSIIHSENTLNAYSFKRKDTMWGRELSYGESGNIRLIRLGKKGSGMWKGNVHERWNVKGPVGALTESLRHYPHQTVYEFVSEINYYSTIRAKELYKKNVSAHGIDLVIYPKAKFIYNYFLRLGCMDGIEGFLLAVMMSFHSFLVRAKLWLLWQEKK